MHEHAVSTHREKSRKVRTRGASEAHGKGPRRGLEERGPPELDGESGWPAEEPRKALPRADRGAVARGGRTGRKNPAIHGVQGPPESVRSEGREEKHCRRTFSPEKPSVGRAGTGGEPAVGKWLLDPRKEARDGSGQGRPGSPRGPGGKSRAQVTLSLQQGSRHREDAPQGTRLASLAP